MEDLNILFDDTIMCHQSLKTNKAIILTLTTLVIFSLSFLYFAPKEVKINFAGDIQLDNKPLSHSLKSFGYVKNIFKEDGDFVKKGDLIVELVSPQEEEQSKHIEQEIEKLKIQINLLQKFEKSINDNINYFNKITEKDFYYRYKSYEVEKENHIKQNNITSQNKVKIENEIQEYKLYLKSIDEKTNLLNKNSSLYFEFESFLSQILNASNNSEIINNEKSLKLAIINEKQESLKDLEAEMTHFDKTSALSGVITELKEIETELENLNHNLEDFHKNAEKLKIKAEKDGYINFTKDLNLGQMIQGGEEIFSVIEDTNQLLINTYVPSNEISKISKETELYVQFEITNKFNRKSTKALIKNISTSPKVNSETGESYYLIQSIIDKKDLEEDIIEKFTFKNGMTINCNFVREKTNYLNYILEKIFK